MIGLKKPAFGRKVRRKREVFRFGGGGKLLPSADIFNCEIGENGILRRGMGILEQYDTDGELQFVSTVLTVRTVFKIKVNEGLLSKDRDEICVALSDGYLYVRSATTKRLTKKVPVGKGAAHYAIRDENGGIYNLFLSSSGAYCTKDFNAFSLVASGTFVQGCACGGRCFMASVDGVLSYSAPFKPLEMTPSENGGGRLAIPAELGDIVGVKTDGGYVYILMQRGIYRLRPSADPSDFVLERVSYAGGEICPYSAVEMGTGIIFLAANGVYRLRGDRAEQICPDLHLSVDSAQEVLAVGRCEDLALVDYPKMRRTATEPIVLKRLAIRADGKGWYVSDRYGTLGGTEYTCVSSVIYRFVRDSLLSEFRYAPYFKSKLLDFGTRKLKTLRKIRLRGQGEVRLRVLCDGTEKEATLSFVGGEAEIALAERGRTFVFTLLPSADSSVEELAVEYVGTEG